MPQALERDFEHPETHCRLADNFLAAFSNPGGDLLNFKGAGLLRHVSAVVGSLRNSTSLKHAPNTRLLSAAVPHYEVCSGVAEAQEMRLHAREALSMLAKQSMV